MRCANWSRCRPRKSRSCGRISRRSRGKTARRSAKAWRVAVLADIHGNALALSAVLADNAGLRVGAMINLGDCFSRPLEPARTAELLLPLDLPTVRGNQGPYCPVLLCGHSHQAKLLTLPDGRLVLNPGSIGAPLYSDRSGTGRRIGVGSHFARYAVLQKRDGTCRADLKAIPYDHGAAAHIATSRGSEDWAKALSTGWTD